MHSRPIKSVQGVHPVFFHQLWAQKYGGNPETYHLKAKIIPQVNTGYYQKRILQIKEGKIMPLLAVFWLNIDFAM